VFQAELVIDVGNVPNAVSPSSTHSAEGADICRILPEAAYVTWYCVFQIVVAVFGPSTVMGSLVVPVPAASPAQPVNICRVPLPATTVLLFTDMVAVVPALYHPDPVVELSGETTVK